MLRKMLLTLSVSAFLGAAAIAPNAALALPLGPPPGLGLGGPPPGPGLGSLPPGPGLGGLPHGPRLGAPGGRPSAFRPDARGLQGRSAASNAGRSTGYSYSRRHGYGHDGWRRAYSGRYGAYAYGSSYATDGCYYTFKYSYTRRTYRRVAVCGDE